MVYRVYVEKKEGQTHEASSLLKEIRDFLQISSLTGLRVLNRYDSMKEPWSCFQSSEWRTLPIGKPVRSPTARKDVLKLSARLQPIQSFFFLTSRRPV